MILYFSGTGNSEYVAKRIGAKIGDEVLNLFDKIRNCDFTAIKSDRPWVVVAPTYAWRIPRILHEWIEATPFSQNSQIYFVMTCGGSIGNAAEYLERLSESKKMSYKGCYQIVMPENYIALFSTPTTERALKTIEQAESKIDNAAELIKNGKSFSKSNPTFSDKMSSCLVYNAFYPMFVHAKKFYATDSCISCGKCEKVCPLNNVSIKNGKPVWGKKCTHCMACICRCPSEAIEYGKHSKGLPRYTCPK